MIVPADQRGIRPSSLCAGRITVTVDVISIVQGKPDVG